VGFQIQGPVVGTDYFPINVTGSVTLTYATLNPSLSTSFVPTRGEVYTVIANDGTDAINGQFSGLSEGAVITLNSVYQFQLSYAGGTGNDVVLAALNGKEPSTSVLVASQNPSNPGQSVTFTATISGNGGTPTGSVTFLDGTTTLTTVSLLAGTASYSTSLLAAGQHSLTVVYPGDTNFGGSTSSVLTQTVATVPAAPTNVSATAGNAQATISFTASPDQPGAPVTSYTVTSSPGNLTATGTASPITVTGLTNGTAYTFTVTATNVIGNGPPSAPSNSVTPATVPNPPTSLAATPGNGQVTISFMAPSLNGGSPITGYTVSSSTGGVDSNAGSLGLVHVVTGLTNGTQYAFTATATNAIGTSVPSASITATPLASQTPQTITFPPLGSKTMGDAPFAISATASSGLTVLFTTQSPSVCTVGGNTVTLGAAGTCTIAADQAGDATYAAAPQVTRSFVVSASSKNVALATNGGVATASSELTPAYPASSLINDDRKGTGWGTGGGWSDATPNVYPDWVRIDFNGAKTIDRVVVYSLQDSFKTPIEPTDTQTFTLYGARGLTVEAWTGSAWTALASSGPNNLVKRTMTFAPYTTTAIRVSVLSTSSNYSRLTEIEAWGTDGPALAATTTVLASSASPATQGSLVTFTATVMGANPGGTVAFTENGTALPGCGTVTLANAGNSGTATCGTTTLALGNHNIVATYGGDVNNAGSASAALTQSITSASGGTAINVALSANGGVATVSSVLSAAYPASSLNDDERKGAQWGNKGGWNDGTANLYPDWARIDFNGAKTVDRVVVYSLQDNYKTPIEPTDTQTFSLYGAKTFTVEGWTGSGWQPLGSVTGNTLVKRTVTFAAFTTTAIRINVTATAANYTRLTEIEAWGVSGPSVPPTTTVVSSSQSPVTQGTSVMFTATVTGTASPSGTVAFTDNGGGIASCGSVMLTGGGNAPTATCTTSSLSLGAHSIVATYGGDAANAGSSSVAFSQSITAPAGTANVALQANGGKATASSELSKLYPATSLNNDERAGAAWGNGGGWNDGTVNAYPDWVRIDFGGSKTIDRVVVYSLQDNYKSPTEPTDTQTFTLFGARTFTVEALDPSTSAWVQVASVTGNNLVKRAVTFTPYTTTAVRVNILATAANYSRLTEIEAWGVDGPSSGSSAKRAQAESTQDAALEIPTLQEVAMALLIAMLMVSGAVAMRRRR
jgi:hypothetical protein